MTDFLPSADAQRISDLVFLKSMAALDTAERKKKKPCWLALTEKHWHSSRWLKARLWVGVKITEVWFFESEIILYDFFTNKNKYLDCFALDVRISRWPQNWKAHQVKDY